MVQAIQGPGVMRRRSFLRIAVYGAMSIGLAACQAPAAPPPAAKDSAPAPPKDSPAAAAKDSAPAAAKAASPAAAAPAAAAPASAAPAVQAKTGGTLRIGLERDPSPL